MATKRERPAAVPLWHVDHVHPCSKKYEFNRGRKQKGCHPPPLSELVGDLAGVHTISTAFYAAHALDSCSLPAEADPAGEPGAQRLDMRRVTCARGGQAILGAVTVYRHALCQSFDLGVKLAGLGDERLCRGSWGGVDLAALEGALLPLYSPACVKRAVTPGDMHTRKFAALGGADDSRHAFALRPTLLLAMTDRKRADATADMMAVGYIVSPRAFNVMTQDEARPLGVWFGDAVHPGYQATLCYFLVVAALPKLPLKMGAANPLDASLWRWADWRAACPGVPPLPGLSDLTMHGGAIWRAVLTRPIAAVAEDLRAWREAGLLDAKLLSSARLARTSGPEPLEGLEARKALLIEYVLRGTPMEFLLDGGSPGQELLAWRVALPRGTHPGRALYDELRRWTRDPQFAAWFGHADLS